jgi:hypothetical protein
LMTLVAIMASGKPRPVPMASRTSDSRIIIRSTLAPCAPSARRIPISLVRRVTLERLRAESARLKNKDKGGLTLKVSEKGRFLCTAWAAFRSRSTRNNGSVSSQALL